MESNAKRQALLKLLLQEEGLQAAEALHIPRRPPADHIPLSFAQQRMWFLDQFEPDSPVYNLPLICGLSGPLKLEALQASLNEIVRRHEALRTIFVSIDGEASQIIQPPNELPVEYVDLRHLPATKREEEAQHHLLERVRQPFNLTTGPLVRATLLRLADQEHILLVNLHHIVADGWSLGVLLRELTAGYQAYVEGQKPDLPELPIQYADFAVWQREWLQGEVLEKEMAYWKRQLEGAPELLELPSDRPRPPRQSYRGTREQLRWPPELVDGLRALCRQEDVTLYMLLLAAFGALLHRYTRQTDILIGSPVANRNQPELKDMVGFFVNMLVLRLDLSGNPTFRELLGRVRKTVIEAQAHQAIPFERLVNALQPERNLSHTPFFQVVLDLQTLPPPTSCAGLTVRLLDPPTGIAKFDLTLNMLESDNTLVGSLEYRTDMFDAPRARQILENFQTLLQGVVQSPETRLTELPLLTDAQRRALLAWGRPKQSYPPGRCIHELVEAQAARSPQAVALTFEGRSMTYAELNARANQLAHFLRKLGVGAESLVALYMDRSSEMIVALLGILKAGGAYVPVDIAYPAARLEFILQDTRSPVLLTTSDLKDRLPPHSAQVVCLDSDWRAIEQESVENLTNVVTPDNLAYIIYTSGSTGQPKGVQVTHYNVVRLFQATEEWFHFSERDVWTMFHTYAFDFSVWEIWGALTYGGRLVVVPYWVSRSPSEMYDLLVNEKVTVLNQTPSAFRQLVQAEGARQTIPELALRLVIFGGEALDLSSLRPWFERHGDQKPQLVNMYGITETTVHVTYRPVTLQDALAAPGSMIGVPIPDLKLVLLDEHRQLVPPGIPGEIYVGGAGVARGYLNRPELTRERFVPDFIDGANGARLYRSGDLARYTFDGDLEYLGRGDLQVKIRGFRIELGEIEAALARHPAVQQCVVIDREDTPGNKQLVAYIVPADPSRIVFAELNRFLQQHLPDYMLPSAYALIEAIPLTPNGKLDRRALPAPQRGQVDATHERALPRNAIEETLARIWRDVLHVDAVGVHDSFFELGGDSILSIQVIARAAQAGLKITPRQIFEHQTIAELAQVIQTSDTGGVEQGPVTGPVPLLPVQRWFFEQAVPEPHRWNQAVIFQVPARFDTPLLMEQVVTALLAHHDALRLRFRRSERGWEQVNAPPGEGDLPFAVIDLSMLTGAEQQQALAQHIAEAHNSLDLEHGPLMRALYFDFGPFQPGRLHLVIHHLVVDGVSWRILLEDVRTLYDQMRQGQVVALPPKTSSFQRWANRLVEYARSDECKREAAYWLDQARRDVQPLPVDFAAEEQTAGGVTSVVGELDEQDTHTLLYEAHAAYNTQVTDLLLTALAQTFAAWTGDGSLLVELEGHGREALFDDLDLSRTVGCFTTMYPVLLESAAAPDVAIKRVKEHLRAVPHNGLGYGLLRYLAERELGESLAAMPQPQVSFNYMGHFTPQALLQDWSEELNRPLEYAFTRAGDLPQLLGPRPDGSHRLMFISGRIEGKRFRVDWYYSQALYRRETIERLVSDYLEALRRLLAHCLSPQAGGYTPSDFPEAELDQSKLDNLMAELGIA